MNLLWVLLLFTLHYTASGFSFRNFFGRSRCRADEEQPWSYRDKNGPKKWGKRYPTCNGLEQSPIDIYSDNAVFERGLAKLSMDNYNIPVTRATIVNNGRTIEVTPLDGIDRTIFVNSDTYRLTQFHFHWGDGSHRGSEHAFNGIYYDMELHFVHQNARRETAVVGVFFQEDDYHAELQNIINNFPKVMYNGTRSELNSPINLNHLLPANPSTFFRYHGSLTTPACDEGVTWSILTLVQSVGTNQMEEFRKLYSVNKSDARKSCRLTENVRPVQPLHGRIVYRSQ